MRTLGAPLTAAQQSASTEPYLPVLIQNRVGAVRRHDFTLLQDEPANANGKHDAAIADNGILNRFRMDAGTVKRQTVTAGVPSAWTNFVAGMGAQVAAAAKGSRLIVIYTDAGGAAIRYRESTDGGANWTADAVLYTTAAAIQDLCVTYKSAAGDLAIGFAHAAAFTVKRRVAGVLQADQAMPTAVNAINGCAIYYAFDWDIVLTGRAAATSAPTLWTVVLGDGGNVTLGTWAPLRVQQQAELSSTTEFYSPFLEFDDSYRMTFVEVPSYPGGGSTTYRTWLHPFIDFNQDNNIWRTPARSSHQNIQGLALAANDSFSDYLYESSCQLVQRSPRALVQLDVTADVLAVDLTELPFATRGHIDLNNSSGQYAGPAAPIAIGNFVDLGFGYRTSGGNVASVGGDLWIRAYEYHRTGGESVLRLYVEGVYEQLARNRQRTAIVNSGQTYVAIIGSLLSRAGLQMTTTGVSARALAVTPLFTIAPDTDGLTALRAALQFIADRPISQNDTLKLTEPLTSEGSDYTFGVAHPLYQATLRTEPPGAAEVQAFGSLTSGAVGTALDAPNAAHELAPLQRIRDHTSATGATVNATAAAHMRQRKLAEDAGHLLVPPHCGLEILDVVQWTDEFMQPAALLRRVQGIRWRYDRKRSVYQQDVALGAL